jgi:hypothetical protein
MRDRRRATIDNLRQAIDCLPRDTKIAMLRGIASNPIIVGAYSDNGGICPMLAAHRAGGRTDFIQFAKAWDRFAFRATRAKRARRATERELLVLRSHLEASLMADEGPAPDLKAAVSEHRRLVHEREQRAHQERPPVRARTRVRPGDPDRSKELGRRNGWAWTRVVRRYDEYERALELLDSQRALVDERPREFAGS